MELLISNTDLNGQTLEAVGVNLELVYDQDARLPARYLLGEEAIAHPETFLPRLDLEWGKL